MLAYIDTSAAAKLLARAPESEAMMRWIDRAQADADGLISSLLLETELRGFAVRHTIAQSKVTDVISGISLAELPPSLFAEAGLLAEPTLRSLDALHLASALRLGVDVVVTYDLRLADAARALGLRVVSPAA